jgi:uncharacterized membrane protein
MMTNLAAYAATLALFLVADMAWLGTMVNRVYRPALGDLLIEGVNLPPAIVFYLLYPVGIVIFAVMPALKGGTIYTAMSYGALFGLFTYATYDLSNHATLRGWPLHVTVIDIAWGTLLGTMAAAAGYLAAAKVQGLA